MLHLFSYMLTNNNIHEFISFSSRNILCKAIIIAALLCTCTYWYQHEIIKSFQIKHKISENDQVPVFMLFLATLATV